MDSKEIIRRRLESQGFGRFTDACALVGWMGCVQAQDFAMAKWAIGVRIAGLTDAAIEADFDAGRLLRTHVLRPTWHFVLPADIGWMLKLTAPRIRAFCQPYHKRLEIDTAVLRRTRNILVKALEGGAFLTRPEVAVLFRRAKIDTSDIRMNFLLIDAELEGLICSGPRRGKQFTYALLEERVGGVGSVLARFEGEEALGELARRYFLSRGPAVLADFAWWSGLTLGEARKGLEVVKGSLDHDGGYWFAPGLSPGAASSSASTPGVLLLPAFDEYTVAYKDRSDVVTKEFVKATAYGLKPVVVVNGRVAGVWRREMEKKKVGVGVTLLGEVSKTAARLIEREVKRYGRFWG